MARAIHVLAVRARALHTRWRPRERAIRVLLGAFPSFVLTRLQPVWIIVVYDPFHRAVLSFAIAPIPSARRPNWKANNGAVATGIGALERAIPFLEGCGTVAFYQHPAFPLMARYSLPMWKAVSFPSFLHSPTGWASMNAYWKALTAVAGPMQPLDHLFRDLEKSLARLGNGPSKSRTIAALEDHLWLFVAKQNGYRVWQ